MSGQQLSTCIDFRIRDTPCSVFIMSLVRLPGLVARRQGFATATRNAGSWHSTISTVTNGGAYSLKMQHGAAEWLIFSDAANNRRPTAAARETNHTG
jgi:hypothetical protein